MNRNIVGTFFNAMEKVATKNNLTDTPGNILKIDEIGIQINNKLGTVMTENGSKNVHVSTPEENSENITVIACRNAAGQFLPLVLICKDVNKKLDFGDGLSPGSDVYMKGKSSCISSDFFFKWFTEHFFKHRASGKVIVLVDGSSLILLQTAIENNVTIVCLPNSYFTAVIKIFFGPLKSHFKN